MTASEFGKGLALFSGVRNPVPAVMDRLGLRHAPYRLHLRSGVAIELRPQAGDLFGFYEIMLRKDYLASGQRLDLGATVIDVGANIGCFTVLAASIVGPTGRVFAIEPEESTYRQLLRNISLNRLTNVTPLRLAVGASQGMITLHTDRNRLFSSVFSSVNGREVGGTEQQVQMTTLVELMNAHQIPHCAYLKLDCEGAEHEIVGNMALDNGPAYRTNHDGGAQGAGFRRADAQGPSGESWISTHWYFDVALLCASLGESRPGSKGSWLTTNGCERMHRTYSGAAVGMMSARISSCSTCLL